MPGRSRRPPRAAVRCEAAQGAISARLDGERPPLAGPALDAHLAGCPVCRDFETAAVALGRQARLRAPRPVPGELVAALVPLLEPARPGFLGSALQRPRKWGYGLAWAGTARWAGAIAPAVVAAVAISVGAGPHPHLVPTRPPSACTMGLAAQHPQRGG